MKSCDERGVRADRGRPPEEGRLAEACQVDRQRAVQLRELGPDGHPVDRAATKAVNHREPAGLIAAEVEIVDQAR